MTARALSRLRRGPLFAVGPVVATVGLAAVIAGAGPAAAAQASVGLGAASSFAVLAHTTVTNTGPSKLSGDLGVSPGTAITGFPPGTVTNGQKHSADALAAKAQNDVTTAYNDAAGRSSSATISGDLGGRTLVPGVYSGGALGLTGTLTLNAQGDPNAVFIFRASSTLITASSSAVRLLGGANACNVFWQVSSSATLGTNSAFTGTVMALASVSAKTGASVSGRLLARTGAVTLDTNSVTRPSCAATSTTSTTAAAAAPTAASTGIALSSAPQLPFTGSHVTATAVAGVLALLMGAALLVVARRVPTGGRSGRHSGSAGVGRRGEQ